MTEWWSQLTLELQIFYGIGMCATGILVIQLVLSLFGLGDHGDAADGVDGGGLDFDHGGDIGMNADVGMGVDIHDGSDVAHASGLQVLSTRTVIAFMAGFGWTGVVAQRGGLGMSLSLLLAMVVGLVLMWLVFSLMRMLYGMRQSGSLDYRNAIGQVGKVYIGIPAAGAGSGQVEVLVQGRLAVVEARCESSEKIPSGSQVRVKKLLSARTLLVEVVNDDSAPSAPLSGGK
ncbi:MAG: hypothetical protein ABIF77_08355 [bacterium]